MRRAFLIVVVIIVIVLVVAGVAIIRRGISTRVAPTASEVAIARAMRHLATPSDARSMRNPVPSTPQVLTEARAHFADHCAECHGNDGSGRTEMGQNLYPRAPDMRATETQALSDGELFFIIKNGVRLSGMPAWGGDGGDTDSWKLVRFIRHLPSMTPAEIESMKALNPISRLEAQEKKEEDEFLEGH